MESPKTAWWQKIALGAFSLVVIELIFQFTAFSYNYIQRKQQMRELSTQSSQQIILCLGESTTAWGQGDSYPAQLQEELDNIYGAGQYVVINEGVSGGDTAKILQSLESNIQKYRPKIIITMMGINDSWQIRGEERLWSSLKLYKFWKLLVHNVRVYYAQSSLPAAVPQAQDPPTQQKTEDPILLLQDQRELIQKAEQATAQKNYAVASRHYANAIEGRSAPATMWFRMAKLYLKTGEKEKAERSFKKFLEQAPQADSYAKVAKVYYYEIGNSDKYGRVQALKYAAAAEKIDAKNIAALVVTGLIYESSAERDSEAQKYLERALELGSRDGNALVALARIYIRKQQFQQAEKTLEMGLEDPTDMGFFIWRDLVLLLQSQNKFDEAYERVEAALERYPNNANLSDTKNEILKAMGKGFDSEHKDIMYWIRNFLEYQPTRQNYRKVAAIIQDYGIHHVAMQYPVRSIAPLKELLTDFQNVVFVENRTNIEAAVNKSGYDAIFNDRFGENFGHMTRRGNRLLVENLVAELQRAKVLPAPKNQNSISE